MELINDLRYAFRQIRQQPAFALMVVVVLGLGIGANTAIFSVVHGVLLSPLPYPDAGRIVRVFNAELPGRAGGWPLSPNEVVEYERRSRSFERFAGLRWEPMGLVGAGGASQVRAARVADGFFAVFGVEPVLGRSFLPEEDRPGHDDVLILSHGLWTRLGADPAMVGRTLVLDGRPRTVVGVMPASFRFPSVAELWVPLALDETRLDQETVLSHGMGTVARLRPGVSVEQAQEEMDAVVQSLEDLYPDHIEETSGALVLTLRDTLVGRTRPALLALLGAVGFLLLIGCTNVANLLLARLESRGREIAIRTALGAGRGRLVRQLLTESVLLSGLGGAVGLAVTAWGFDALRLLLPANLPRADDISIDRSVLLFSLALSLLTGLLFGVLPALRATRQDVNATLKEGGRSASGRDWFRSGLVVSEVGLVLVLLAGAAMMGKTVWRLQQVDTGLDSSGVLAFELSPPEGRYRDEHQVTAFYDGLLERLRALPAVESAGAISWLPIADTPSNWGIELEGPIPEEANRVPDYALIAGDYLEANGIRVLRGRPLRSEDRHGVPGVLVTESMARMYWPGQDPLGRQLRLETDPTWRTVVGVVADYRNRTTAREPAPGILLPQVEVHTGHPFLPRTMNVTLRAAGDPSALLPAVRSTVAEMDPEVVVARVQTMEEVLAGDRAPARSLMTLLGAFATLGLVLGCVGVYGVISFGVARRRREFGIRIALGARTAHLLRMVLGGTLALVGAGVGAGLLVAYAAGRLALAGLLFEVQPSDPAVLASVAAAVVGVALLAALLPAVRAGRVDPLAALREE